MSSRCQGNLLIISREFPSVCRLAEGMKDSNQKLESRLRELLGN